MIDNPPPPPDERAELSALVEKMPKSFQRWSYQQTLDFKDAVMKGRQVCGNARSTRLSIQAALQKLRRFHTE